jgi:hypothetical protein
VALLVATGGAFPGAVVRADNLPNCGSGSGQPCVLGNLEVVRLSGNLFEKHSGGGGGCVGNGGSIGNFAIDNSDPPQSWLLDYGKVSVYTHGRRHLQPVRNYPIGWPERFVDRRSQRVNHLRCHGR